MLTRQPENQRIFPKEKCICEPDSFLSQTAHWYVRERAPYSLCSPDQTTRLLLAAWDTRRSHQKQIGAHGGKCPLTTTSPHPQAAGETANMHEDRSNPSCALGKGCSSLEASALYRPGRRHCCVGIVSSSACTGSAGQRSTRLAWGYLQRPSL